MSHRPLSASQHYRSDLGASTNILDRDYAGGNLHHPSLSASYSSPAVGLASTTQRERELRELLAREVRERERMSGIIAEDEYHAATLKYTHSHGLGRTGGSRPHTPSQLHPHQHTRHLTHSSPSRASAAILSAQQLLADAEATAAAEEEERFELLAKQRALLEEEEEYRHRAAMRQQKLDELEQKTIAARQKNQMIYPRTLERKGEYYLDDKYGNSSTGVYTTALKPRTLPHGARHETYAEERAREVQELRQLREHELEKERRARGEINKVEEESKSILTTSKTTTNPSSILLTTTSLREAEHRIMTRAKERERDYEALCNKMNSSSSSASKLSLAERDALLDKERTLLHREEEYDQYELDCIRRKVRGENITIMTRTQMFALKENQGKVVAGGGGGGIRPQTQQSTFITTREESPYAAYAGVTQTLTEYDRARLLLNNNTSSNNKTGSKQLFSRSTVIPLERPLSFEEELLRREQDRSLSRAGREVYEHLTGDARAGQYEFTHPLLATREAGSDVHAEERRREYEEWAAVKKAEEQQLLQQEQQQLQYINATLANQRLNGNGYHNGSSTSSSFSSSIPRTILNTGHLSSTSSGGNTGAPTARLRLDWIYGYSSSSHSHNNIFYNNTGELIYPQGNTIIIYKKSHRVQKYWREHTCEVRCLAQHPVNLNIIASAQGSERERDVAASEVAAAVSSQALNPPAIHIYDTTDLQRSWFLPLSPYESISKLAFSTTGEYLVSIAADAEHTLKIWKWEGTGGQGGEDGKSGSSSSGVCLGSARTGHSPIYAIRWNHKDPTEFITVGKNSHLMFWKFDGVKLTARKGVIPGNTKESSSFYSVTFSEKGYACIGSDGGRIFVFVDGKLVREFRGLHGGSVSAVGGSSSLSSTQSTNFHASSKLTCLEWYPGGLISGGSDGKVNVYDRQLTLVRRFSFRHRITALYIRGNHLLIGTQGSSIYEITDFLETKIEGDRESVIEMTIQESGLPRDLVGPITQEALEGRIGVDPVVQGHYDGELHAVACTTGREIISVGEDNQILVWDMNTHRLMRKGRVSEDGGVMQAKGKHHHQHNRQNNHHPSPTSSHPLHQCSRSLCISPNSRYLLIGTNNGHVSIYTTQDLKKVFVHDLNQYSEQVMRKWRKWEERNLKEGGRERGYEKEMYRDDGYHHQQHHHSNPPPTHHITSMSFSPSGNTVAIGTSASIIVLLDTRDEYRVKGVLTTHVNREDRHKLHHHNHQQHHHHSQPLVSITSLDWSEDGHLLSSSDSAYQLKYHKIVEADLAQSQEVAITEQQSASLRWTTQSNALTPQVVGILAASRHTHKHIECVEVSPSRAYVLSGNEDGEVQLFKYPIMSTMQQSQVYKTHAAFVTNVKWTKDEKYVVTTSADNVICQWALV